MMLEQTDAFDVFVQSGDTYVRHNTAVSPMYGRFCHNTLNTQLQALSVQERAALLAGRRLQYPANYDMPDNARIYWYNDPTAGNLITVWNVIEDTEGAWRGPGGQVIVNTVQVEKIDQVG